MEFCGIKIGIGDFAFLHDMDEQLDRKIHANPENIYCCDRIPLLNIGQTVF
jgi:hypothetical protein